MAAKRYDGEQMAQIVQAIGAGTRIAEMCRKYNVSRTTIHRWQKKFQARGEASTQDGQMNHRWVGTGGETAVAGVRALEAENVRLKRIVVRQALQIDALQELVSLRDGN